VYHRKKNILVMRRFHATRWLYPAPILNYMKAFFLHSPAMMIECSTFILKISLKNVRPGNSLQGASCQDVIPTHGTDEPVQRYPNQ
jgi:hypothetical protein